MEVEPTQHANTKLTFLLLIFFSLALFFRLTIFLFGEDPRRLVRAKAPVKECDSTVETEQCIKVNADYYGCSGGGKATAINVKYKLYWEEELPQNCSGTSCLGVMSDDPSCFQEPVCLDNVCKLVDSAG